MSDKTRKIGLIICSIGACSVLAVGLFGLAMIVYWRYVTGSWLDDHIFFWQGVGMPCVISVFLFTRVLMPMFERQP